MIRGRRDLSYTPFWLRVSVVVGGVSLLLGVIGAVAMVVRGDVEMSDLGPGYRPALTLTGLPDDAWADVTVSVRWWEATLEAQVRQDAEPVAGVPGSYGLPPDAVGREVELEIFRGRELLERHKAEIVEGRTLRLDLAAAPPR